MERPRLASLQSSSSSSWSLRLSWSLILASSQFYQTRSWGVGGWSARTRPDWTQLGSDRCWLLHWSAWCIRKIRMMKIWWFRMTFGSINCAGNLHKWCYAPRAAAFLWVATRHRWKWKQWWKWKCTAKANIAVTHDENNDENGSDKGKKVTRDNTEILPFES